MNTPSTLNPLAAALRPTSVLTTGDAAVVSGRSDAGIRRLCERGEIAATRTAGKPSHWQIPEASLRAWLNR